ncbi:MAG: GntR family transcriptional regulator [Candidatus Rokubacteria bacterium]|nr:GntR family transcriptional regulator [Candidatus Rokubacteria bacterium]MBI3825862.1 GntR family transcriptional regulator [Candidatus Rokubacteria bacterium]
MKIPTDLKVDARSPIPIRRQLTEQIKHVIEGGGVPRDEALPSIRELAGFLAINPNTVARVIEDLKHGGYVEAHRGRGVFVAPVPPARPSPHLRERFLQDVVIQAAARGITADDLAVGVLSLAQIRPVAVQDGLEILLVECSPAELDFFAREIEAHLPVHVDKVLLHDLPSVARRERRAARWGAAVTSFGHLPEVERLLGSNRAPVVALLAEAHLETLHRLAQRPSGTRVGVASAAAETAHNLEHSIANAGLPNITLVGTSPAEGAALGRLLRRVDVVVCPTSAAERVRALAGATVQVMIDDRALDPRAIEMLAALLVQRNGDKTAARPGRRRPRPSSGGTPRRSAARETARTQ